jgi:hypothetical protein
MVRSENFGLSWFERCSMSSDAIIYMHRLPRRGPNGLDPIYRIDRQTLGYHGSIEKHWVIMVGSRNFALSWFDWKTLGYHGSNYVRHRVMRLHNWAERNNECGLRGIFEHRTIVVCTRMDFPRRESDDRNPTTLHRRLPNWLEKLFEFGGSETRPNNGLEHSQALSLIPFGEWPTQYMQYIGSSINIIAWQCC